MKKKEAVWDVVIEDMRARHEVGLKTYGRPLTPFNGRDVFQDIYEEALDLVVYLKQAILELDGIKKRIRAISHSAGQGQKGIKAQKPRKKHSR